VRGAPGTWQPKRKARPAGSGQRRMRTAVCTGAGAIRRKAAATGHSVGGRWPAAANDASTSAPAPGPVASFSRCRPPPLYESSSTLPKYTYRVVPPYLPPLRRRRRRRPERLIDGPDAHAWELRTRRHPSPHGGRPP